MGRLVSALTSLPGSYTGSLAPDDNPQSYSLAPGEGQERVDQSSDAVVRSPFVDKVGDGYVEHAQAERTEDGYAVGFTSRRRCSEGYSCRLYLSAVFENSLLGF